MNSKVIVRMTLGACLGTLIAYAFLVEPNWLQVTYHRIPSGNQPATIRIAQLSDLHLHDYGRREQGVVDELSRIKPDLVLLTGDVIGRTEALPVLDAFLTASGDVPKLAVLGNWEYWGGVDVDALRALYELHHVRLLLNQTERLVVHGKKVVIVGLDDYTAGNPVATPSRLRLENGERVILLQHSPGMFDDVRYVNAISLPLDLCLSGHTHAGQFALFGVALWRPPGSGNFVSGMYATEHCPLYVSRGIGTSVLPARLGARPEIAVFDM